MQRLIPSTVLPSDQHAGFWPRDDSRRANDVGEGVFFSPLSHAAGLVFWVVFFLPSLPHFPAQGSDNLPFRSQAITM